jgi:hypothetical protein
VACIVIADFKTAFSIRFRAGPCAASLASTENFVGFADLDLLVWITHISWTFGQRHAFFTRISCISRLALATKIYARTFTLNRCMGIFTSCVAFGGGTFKEEFIFTTSCSLVSELAFFLRNTFASYFVSHKIGFAGAASRAIFEIIAGIASPIR